MGWTPRLGLATALAVIAAVLASLAAGLDEPWWAAISAWIVSNPDRTAVLSKSVMRVIGTIVGCLLGIVLARLIGGVPLFYLAALFLAGAVGSRQRFANRYGYAWLYCAITLLLLLFASMTNVSDLYTYALHRAWEIIFGVLAVLIFGFLIAPRPQPAAQAAVAGAASSEDAHDFNLDLVTLIGGLLPVTVALAWAVFDLPSVIQIAISSLILIDRDVGTIHVRAQQRLGGCLLGGVTGLLIAGLSIESFFLWAIMFGGGIFVFSKLHHGGGPHAYVGTQAGVAFIVTLVTGFGPPADLVPIISRVSGVLIGVLFIIFLSHLVTWPRRAAERPSDGATE